MKKRRVRVSDYQMGVFYDPRFDSFLYGVGGKSLRDSQLIPVEVVGPDDPSKHMTLRALLSARQLNDDPLAKRLALDKAGIELPRQ